MKVYFSSNKGLLKQSQSSLNNFPLALQGEVRSGFAKVTLKK